MLGVSVEGDLQKVDAQTNERAGSVYGYTDANGNGSALDGGLAKGTGRTDPAADNPPLFRGPSVNVNPQILGLSTGLRDQRLGQSEDETGFSFHGNELVRLMDAGRGDRVRPGMGSDNGFGGDGLVIGDGCQGDCRNQNAE